MSQDEHSSAPARLESAHAEEAHTHEDFQEGEEEAPAGVRSMAIIRWLLVLAMSIAAAASLYYVFGDTGKAQGNESGTQYYCPMHPSVVQEYPGECPICSMTLVPREASKKGVLPSASQSEATADHTDHSAHRHEESDPYYCPMHPQETGQDSSARCPLCSMKLESKPQGTSNRAGTESAAEEAAHAGHRHEESDPYYCPMHPQETGADASERCPLCSMKLEKRPKKSQADEPDMGAKSNEMAGLPPAAPSELSEAIPGVVPVEIASDRVQLIGMRTAKVKRTSMTSEIRATAYVAPTESGLAVIQTRFSGWIQELHVSQTSQLVKRGQLLARIYSPELLAAQQELLNAKQWGQGAGGPRPDTGSTLADNARNRLLLMGMDPSEVAEVERSNKLHQLVEVRSPVRGYVAQKNALQGLYIQPGTRLFDIADLSKVWVMIEVFERDAARVGVGQSASLRLDAYPNAAFEGKVQLIYPAVNTDTRTMLARIEFKNPDLRLRPGMFGNVTIQASGAVALVVPRDAIVDTGEHQYVFVAQEGGHFSPRAVRIGASSDNDVQVLAGLSEGETVVTTGNFLIDSESRLRATIEGIPEATSEPSSACEELFDRKRFAAKYERCRACESQHRGMGRMEEDCRNAIAKPWR
jgi:multidrug efflux pump subunit AcrA (membrane-fusion protein)